MKGVIFFGHGARDIRWREPFDQLIKIWQTNYPDQEAKLAFLELMTPSLPECISAFVQTGVTKICVIPVFFGQGGHLRKDLPQILEACQLQFPQIELSTSPAVGESEAVLQSIIQFAREQVGQ
jgi:sirohydrochlorin cobaltochelatase